jgi:hypothetical protein
MSADLELHGRRALVTGAEYVIDGGKLPTV